jgi:ribose 5-phosphate isomerase B
MIEELIANSRRALPAYQLSTFNSQFFKLSTAAMRIALGTDHAGFEYKEVIRVWLGEHGHEVRDFGTFSRERCDYPDFIRPAAQAVANGECERAIVLGGSGNGEAIVANKVRGVRCGLCWNEESARLSRQHNDANVLSLGQRMISRELALRIVEIWLSTAFEGGRHIARIAKIESV